MRLHAQHRLARTRRVSIKNGLFLLHYGMRSDFADHLTQHGITNAGTIDDYEHGLRLGYQHLTTRFGWPELEEGFSQDVAIRDLGIGRYGLANPDGYMVFTSRALEADSSMATRHRRSIAVHELVHVLQFQSPLFQYWNKKLMLAGDDPIWWLHEATALASEFLAGQFRDRMIPKLWDWANTPHKSFESDLLGYRALPFLLYLMGRFGRDFPSRIYYGRAGEPTQLDAPDSIDSLLNSMASNNQDLDLATVFLDYAVLWAMPRRSLPRWSKVILHVVGRPTRSRCQIDGAGLQFKIQPIEHLGFRFVELDLHANPTPMISRLSISHVSKYENSKRLVLKGRILIEGRNGKLLSTIQGIPKDDRCVFEIPQLEPGLIRRATLVIVNGAHGNGHLREEKSEIKMAIE